MTLDPVLDPRLLPTLTSLVLFDCRTGPKAHESYRAGHLAGAIFADLDTDLSAKSADAAQGGRHPLPPAARFAAWLGTVGVTPTSHVVIYDEQEGANAAARLWWMLRALGHERVQVLDGGLRAALEAGLTLTSEPTHVEPAAPYPASAYAWPTASIDEVDDARSRADRRVLDVRAA